MAQRPYRILLVDDAPEDREMYRRAFRDGGERQYEILEADTGEAGLLICSTMLPDCVILDHRLPDMDAVSFLVALAGGVATPTVPVLVLTGQGNEAIAVRALKAGAHDYLVKGVTPQELRAAVHQAIANFVHPGEQTYRVLVVDDSDEDRELYRRILAKSLEKIDIEEVKTGAEGITRCGTFEPDCVLLDFGLPDMDGLEVLGELLQRYGEDQFAVLILTGQGNESVAVRALKAGAEDYLVKGPALNGLMQSIRSGVEKVALRRKLEEERREVERSRNELARAAKNKDDFLTMLAHELRNPLGPIRNSVQVLRMRRGDWQSVDFVCEIMERQVGHLSRLVDDLLDVTRITQGRIKLKVQQIDGAHLAARCASDHRSTFEAAGIELTVHVPAQPIWVKADPTRLTQILDNLLSNAVKFTNSGGQVWVSVAAKDNTAWFSVRDNGTGIPPDILPNIFDVFTQADKSLDRSRGGLGVGLAVVKGLVELHDGRVYAQSEGLGRGAEISFSLPLKAELPALTSTLSNPHFTGANRRVLVVEDQPDSAETLRMLLELWDLEVRLAFSGPDGLRLAKDWNPDFIICDIGLPGLDGFEVARRLRNDEATAHVRLIALTGYGQDSDMEVARSVGFDDFIIKPAEPKRLQAALSRPAG